MTHELLMSKKCKTKLRMMITVVGLMMMVMMMMMIMKMMVILKLKMMTMMIMMMIVVIMLTMNVGNIVDGVTANGDVSNIKHLIGETRWCFLKHKTLQVGEEITFTFCTTTSEQNDCSPIRNNSFMNIRPNNIRQNFDTAHWDTSGRSNITNIMKMYMQFTYINCVM